MSNSFLTMAIDFITVKHDYIPVALKTPKAELGQIPHQFRQLSLTEGLKDHITILKNAVFCQDPARKIVRLPSDTPRNELAHRPSLHSIDIHVHILHKTGKRGAGTPCPPHAPHRTL
jgi:hypothetical protein